MRILLLAILIYVLYRLFVKKEKKESYDIGEMIQDPNCKTYIPKEQAYMREIGGKRYFFCSKECADIFEKKMKEGDG